jgi:N-methylhydantoinase A
LSRKPAVRVGVDVGGTFTKAVAFDLTQGTVVAAAVVPTTHDHSAGAAAGVVSVVAKVASAVGAEVIELVTYSTTQAVNALLEGDVSRVGVLGLGRAPDLRRSRKRTTLDRVELSPGRRLDTVNEFLDVTDGLDDRALFDVLDRFVAAGVAAVCVAEVFATENGVAEREAVQAAIARGLPACGSSEMSGLYGLQLRAVTAALNASILPIAVRTAAVVEQGVGAAGITCPVMVMRGDGGATDLDGFRRAPARTLYSGPAASVAGVLRFARLADGVVVEVGGTSTNVAAVKAGKPALSYVQVASHATALRALDVRVVGVAGGSMLRARKGRVYGVGPRSAHIAGLPYACFLPSAAEFDGARAELIAPRPGDPPEYVVLRLRDGRLVALTNTCAANALGLVAPSDYAKGSSETALAAFAVAGQLLRLPGPEVARRMLEASGQAVAELVTAVIREHELAAPTLVAVGGGAGGLGRYVAGLLGLDCLVPEGAEVISSIGDALSLVRAEQERTLRAPDPDDYAWLSAAAEAECLAAGAAPGSVDVRVEYDSERSTLRAVAVGAVGLRTGALPGRPPIDAVMATAVAREHGCRQVQTVGAFWVGEDPVEPERNGVPANGKALTKARRIVVLDRFGDVVVDTFGAVLFLDAEARTRGTALADLVAAYTRRLGPMTMTPTVWVVHGARLVEVGSGDVVVAADRLIAAAAEPVAAVVGRP